MGATFSSSATNQENAPASVETNFEAFTWIQNLLTTKTQNKPLVEEVAPFFNWVWPPFRLPASSGEHMDTLDTTTNINAHAHSTTYLETTVACLVVCLVTMILWKSAVEESKLIRPSNNFKRRQYRNKFNRPSPIRLRSKQ